MMTFRVIEEKKEIHTEKRKALYHEASSRCSGLMHSISTANGTLRKCRYVFPHFGVFYFFKAGDRKEKTAWDELEPSLYRIYEEAISIGENVL